MTQKVPVPQISKGSLIATAAAAALAILVICGYLVHRGNVAARLAEQQNAKKVTDLEAAQPSDLKADGPLRDQLRQMNDLHDTDTSAAGRALDGTVVEWTLTVFEVDPKGATYRIQTSDRNKVETVLTVIPSDAQSRSRIKSLRTGDSITVRGVIRGISMTRVEINPAILVH